jgi:hypothetical protein
MLHNLTIGHLDPAAILQLRRAVARKPLDMTIVRRLLAELGEQGPDGEWRLGTGLVEFRDGYIVIPWLSHGTTMLSEEFALRLHQETGCVLADREHSRIVAPEQLEALDRKAAPARIVR